LLAFGTPTETTEEKNKNRVSISYKSKVMDSKAI
jgi:hypothetical protein